LGCSMAMQRVRPVPLLLKHAHVFPVTNEGAFAPAGAASAAHVPAWPVRSTSDLASRGVLSYLASCCKRVGGRSDADHFRHEPFPQSPGGCMQATTSR